MQFPGAIFHLCSGNETHVIDTILWYTYPSIAAEKKKSSPIIQYLVHRRKDIKKKDKGRACFRFYSSVFSPDWGLHKHILTPPDNPYWYHKNGRGEHRSGWKNYRHYCMCVTYCCDGSLIHRFFRATAVKLDSFFFFPSSFDTYFTLFT